MTLPLRDTHASARVSQKLPEPTNQDPKIIKRSSIIPFAGVEPTLQIALPIQEVIARREKIEDTEVKRKYQFNPTDNTVRFFPHKPEWRKQLNPIEHFYCRIFPKGCLYFNGRIDLERFLDAFDDTLEYFDCLFGRVHTKEASWCVSYSTNESGEEYFVQLEIEEKPESMQGGLLNTLYPQKIDPKIRPFLKDCEGLPMGSFKLTRYEDGFAIGYQINHAFFDQSSTVYFFKCLAQIYTEGNRNFSLAKPFHAELEFLQEEATVYKDLSEFKEHSHRFGLKYLSDPTELMMLFSKPVTGVTLELRFNASAIEKVREQVKESSKAVISANDIIHAILIKIYSMKFSSSPEESLHFSFACNMRRRCDLGQEALGNLIGTGKMSIPYHETKASIAELAIKNRECVNQINVCEFEEMLNWFKSFKEFEQNVEDYIPVSCVEPNTWFVTNWSSFDYDSIKFDACVPASIKTDITPNLRAGVITFDQVEGEKVLNVIVNVAESDLAEVQALGKTTKLFDLKIQEGF